MEVKFISRISLILCVHVCVCVCKFLMSFRFVIVVDSFSFEITAF